jgi:hypothetical protein
MRIPNQIGVRFSLYPTKNGQLRFPLAICLFLIWMDFQTNGAVFYVTDSLDDAHRLTLRKAVNLPIQELARHHRFKDMSPVMGNVS